MTDPPPCSLIPTTRNGGLAEKGLGTTALAVMGSDRLTFSMRANVVKSRWIRAFFDWNAADDWISMNRLERIQQKYVETIGADHCKPPMTKPLQAELMPLGWKVSDHRETEVVVATRTESWNGPVRIGKMSVTQLLFE